MSSFTDKFTGGWMLTGERLETYHRVLKVDLYVAIPCAILTFVLSLSNSRWLSLLPLLLVFYIATYRLLKKQTLWQLKRLELHSGKNELKSMKQDMEKLISTHNKSKKEHIK
jgi:c-di-AMP phosphodiesterase-like protein